MASASAHGDRVALFLGNCWEFLACVFACNRIGAIVVPIGTRQRQAELEFLLNDSGAKILIFESDLAKCASVARRSSRARADVFGPRHGERRTAVRRTSRRSAASAGFARHIRRRCRGDPLYFGNHGAAERRAIDPSRNHSFRPHLRPLSRPERDRPGTGRGAAVSRDGAGRSCIVDDDCRRLRGADAPGIQDIGFSGAGRAARRSPIRSSFRPSTRSARCIRNSSSCDLTSWRIGCFGGAPMPVATIEMLAERLPHLQLLNAYGATETTSPSTVMPRTQWRGHIDSVGVTVPCGRIKVVDDGGHEVPRRHAGRTLDLRSNGGARLLAAP